ncbi:hypothetical protein TraAM80_01323 [Trypanosoma rangeli]|uniref:Uncharacterized protein n=1 Tax=Trypanosoma rangeli TaxID=5698 RepID=A0A3S5ISE0_TRYRA|nr:uncharacterized protein TraAM80_01323 [Trypanosoma rangeli]RNF10762.1 hypothetical protein TraAM80_01323 [Trypanosoma rangeli]|eukprot:RNF10762.1 hypothetical protein TraAM80_01323 [Trypanosoma rangeli]
MTEATGASPVLADIVERLIGNGAEPRSMLRPIQAIVGRPFPRCLSDRCYGQRTADSRCRGEAMRTTPATAAGLTHGLTAHVQPEVDGGADNHADPVRLGLYAGTGVMATLARQHQWKAKEFADLARGYYAVPLCFPKTEAESPAPVQGEAYVELLLQFLCSTVRTHRECATAALQARLMVDAKLRERCAFGPGCAQLLHLLITELSSGHTVPCSTAAECLVWLLYDITPEVVEAVGEIGVPPTDAAARAEEARQHEDTTTDNNETTFADLSEWMRSGEDKARALEQLGLTTSVMDALGVLRPSVAARLLLGGGVLSLPPVAVRLASDPRYAGFVAERLGSVVAGVTPLGEIVEELLVLRRVLHVRQACIALLPLLHEVLVLFLRHVCAAPGEELHSLMEVVACLAAFLVLRAFVRHGLFGVFHDIGDTLFTAVGVGACMPAEMWLLLTAAPIEACGVELARVALQTLLPRMQAVEVGVGDAASPGHCVALLATLTSTHYLATYFTVIGGAAEASALLGFAGETQQCVQDMLANCLLTSTGLQHAFTRFWDHRVVGGATTPDTPPFMLNMQSFVEAAWASLTHARVRLMAATHNAFPALRCEASMGYAAALAIDFEQHCMALSQLTGHLLPDELCTMIEVAGFMHRHTRTMPVDQRRHYTRDTYVAEIFILHGIAATKHCLDAAPTMIAAMLGFYNDTEFGAGAAALPPSPPSPVFELGQSLGRAVVQTQWPWFLFPLYDTELTCKSAWCAWLQQALGAHQCMKRLLGWDVILCHALKWAVLHRETQRDWAIQHEGSDGAFSSQDADLMVLLEALCSGVLPSLGGVITDTAADTLKELTAYAAPHAEESMSRRLVAALAVTATACAPPVAVALARLIAHTVVGGNDTRRGASPPAQPAAATTTTTTESANASDGCGSDCTSSVSSEHLLRRWAATGRLSDALPPTGAVTWELGDFVELLQVVAERQGAFMRAGQLGGLILQHLVEGAARAYLRQHHPPTAFERQVLRRMQAELTWYPACLHEALADPQGPHQ